MAMLKFNKGLLDSLKTKAISEGNVYITTDEHAMYVDVDSSTRIRIGQIVEKTSTEWAKLPQPYDPSTYYYITDINALVRWNSTKQEWVQINGTADIKADVADLKGRMTTAETNIGTLTSDLSTLTDRVDGIASVGGEANLVNGATAGGADVTITDKKLVLGKFAAANKTTIAKTDLEASFQEELSTMSTNISNNGDAITTLKGEEGVTGSVKQIAKSYADSKDTAIAEAKKAGTDAQSYAEGVSSKVGTGLDGKTLTVAVTELQGTVGTHGSNIGTLQSEMEQAQRDIDAVEADLATTKTTVGNNTTLAQKGVDDAAAAKTVADRAEGKADTNAGEIATLKTNTGNNANEITTIKNTYETKANVETVRSGLQDQIDDIKEAIGTAGDGEDSLVSRVGANEDAIEAINTKIGEVTDGTTLAGSIKTVSDNLADLTDKVGNVTNIMNFVGVSTTDPAQGTATVDGSVVAAQKGDVVLYGDKEFVYDGSKWVEYGDATGNASAITALDGRVTAVENDLNTAETGLKARMTAVENKATTNATNIGNLDTTVKAMYTNAQIDALLAWGTF